jgi:hypothetical protein
VFACGCKEGRPRLLDDKSKITQTQRWRRFRVVGEIYLDSHYGSTSNNNNKKMVDKVCRQDFGGTTKVETQEQQSNQDAQTSRKKVDETEFPVKTGRAPHNADGTQRTEMTKGGTDPSQFSNKASKGK